MTEGSIRSEPSARLYCLLASGSPRAVILRRGPSKQVRLLAWDRSDDRIVPGQWFKGRIYERRCDLSPDGSLFVYFAAKHRPPFGTWTAVSRPPDLTALSFFPHGDAWGGGGLFAHDGTLRFNRKIEVNPVSVPSGRKTGGKKAKIPPRYLRQTEARPWENRVEPGLTAGLRRVEGARNRLNLKIVPLWEHAGSGEDDPIEAMRLERDGWTWEASARATQWREVKHGGPVWLTADPPSTRRKAIGASGLFLRIALHGIHERDGRWYVETMEIAGAGVDPVDFGRIDWADVDDNGDLLHAAEGKLLRTRVALEKGAIRTATMEIADLNAMRFEPVAPAAGGGAEP